MAAQAAQAKQPTLLGRAARMVLVFLLVFGMSFRVEMALAADDVATSDLKGHEEGELVDLAVCKVAKGKVDVADGVVRSLGNMVDDKNDKGLTLEFGDSVTLAAAPKWKGEDKFDASAAKYVEWKVGDAESAKPTVTVTNDGTLGEKVTVTCTVSADAKDYLSKKLTEAKATKITFPITMKPEPEPEPEVTTKGIPEPMIVLVGENLKEGASDLVLTLEQGASYQFVAKVSGALNTYNAAKEVVDTQDFAYSSDSGKTLAAASDGLLKDLKWELFDTDKKALDETVAAIDQNGMLSVKQDSAFTVQCTVSTDDEQVVVPFQVTVTCGNPDGKKDEPVAPEDPEEKKADQGTKLPQDSIHVHGYVATAAMAAGVNAADEPASSSAAAEGEGSEPSASSEASSSTASSEAGDGKTELDKTFSVADIEALGSSQSDFTMKSESAGEITVTGQGPALEALLTSMGVENFEGIHELKFINGEKDEASVEWSALSGAVVAVKSYVHDPEVAGQESGSSSSSSSAEGDESGAESAEGSESAESSGKSAADSSESAPELLENTRFRILSNGLTAAEVDALRWVNEIVINPGEEPAPVIPEEPDPEAPFTVEAGYAPSPIGQEAVFWPIPSKEIAGATFDYVWEESADKVNWTEVSKNVTYRTTTTKERIGHWFRVTLSSDMVDEATGKKLKDTSDPVEMIEGNGVSLVYDPPVAGNVATFNVKFTGFSKNFDYSSLEYIWELSTDGCATWQKLASQYQGKSTLSIQTDKIDEDDSAKEPVTPVYIRCRVVGESLKPVIGETVGIAGPQMLQVYTGESDEESKGSTPSGAKPVTTVKDGEKKDGEKKEKKTEKEKEDIKLGGESSVPTPDGTEPVPVDAVPELHINDEVTEQILEQEEAVQEQIEQTVPGARWTKIDATQPTGDDVNNVLANNPFAPFAIPTGLGITIAGGLEKLLAFRRQL